MRYLASFFLVMILVSGAKSAVPELSEVEGLIDKVEADVLTLKLGNGGNALTLGLTARTRCFLEISRGNRPELHELEASDLESGQRVTVYYRGETGAIFSVQLFPKPGSALIARVEAEAKAAAEAERAASIKPVSAVEDAAQVKKENRVDERKERAADKLLFDAKRFLREAKLDTKASEGLKRKAREKLEAILDKYPGTRASADAQKVLDDL